MFEHAQGSPSFCWESGDQLPRLGKRQGCRNFTSSLLPNCGEKRGTFKDKRKLHVVFASKLWRKTQHVYR